MSFPVTGSHSGVLLGVLSRDQLRSFSAPSLDFASTPWRFWPCNIFIEHARHGQTVFDVMASVPDSLSHLADLAGTKTLYSFYNKCAGMSRITGAGVEYDKYNNPVGAAFDLGRDNAFSEFTLLIGLFYPCSMEPVLAALRTKGFRVTVTKDMADFEAKLPTAHTAWVISNDSAVSSSFARALTAYHQSGRGLMIYGDNEPLFTHANVFLDQFGIQLIGNYYGNLLMHYSESASPGNVKTGEFCSHEVLTGMEHLYEGITICHPSSVPADWLLLARDTKGDPTVIVYPGSEAPRRGRIVVDNGFTKLYCSWDNAGTGRYICNAAVWLLGFH